MGDYNFQFNGAALTARAGGTIWWANKKTLIVSDLHLGKSARMARRNGVLIPPYETGDTLVRLAEEIFATQPILVICLGDSFDDLQAMDELGEEDTKTLSTLMAGREWIWIEGNHDAGPVNIGGQHLASKTIDGVGFRHIASGAVPEVSGHYHPKARLAGASRPCFLIDQNRIIMPAFGTYTGGLRITDPVFKPLMDQDAIAVMTGLKTRVIPMRQD